MKVLYTSLLVLALLLTTAPPAASQDTPAASFVKKLDITEEAVTFETEGRYVGFTLQVGGPDDFYMQRRFSGDETPQLHLKNEAGTLVDGSYAVRVTAQPMIPADARAALEEARSQDDRARIKQIMKELGVDDRAMVYSMHIGVFDGRFINPFEENDKEAMGALDADAPRLPTDMNTFNPVRLTGETPDMTAQTRGPAAGHRAASADVTRTSLDQALDGVDNEALPPFLTDANNPDAPWQKAYFQNTTSDGSTALFEGYLRPVMVSDDGQVRLLQAFFREADDDGIGFGSWQPGYFQQSGDGFRFLRRDEVEQTTATHQAPLFDYMTQEDHMEEKLGVPRRDIQHLDDVIITFSLCVGNDCVNGESFGFDTVRLKENNLRIHFDDTSNSSSFPRNDWRITINGSNNGDPSYFAVEDATAGNVPFRILAGAGNNALYVNASGNMGMGTSTPVVEAHMADGDTPTLRLEQNGSSGFTPQTWDVAGNETNFFVRDVTNSSKLPFRIRPNSPESSVDIHTNGVGIRTTSPDGRLHVKRTSGAPAFLVNNDDGSTPADFIVDENGNVGIGIDTPGIKFNIADTNPQFRLTTNAGQIYSFIAIGGSGVFAIRDVSAGNANRLTINSSGDVNIPGTLSKGGGSFKIDHPLDPENKYLYHSFVESPDMMNVYNGNVTLNAAGEAIVELPTYFQALNRDFRYQLTAIGAPGPDLYVAEEINGNRFRIAGGNPGAKVSWQVTGIRQDPWAERHRIQTEADKPRAVQGYYLHPEAYNQPLERSIDYRTQQVEQQAELEIRDQ